MTDSCQNDESDRRYFRTAGRVRWAEVCSALTTTLLVLLSTSIGQADTLTETLESVLPRVVKIYGSGGLGGLEPYSTGFLVSRDGHVATVWNHVLDADTVTVVLNDGRRFAARVVGAEPPLDLAILKLQSEDVELPYFDLSQAVTARPGTRVLAFCNMFGIASGDEPVSVVHGVLAAYTRLSARKGSYETTYDGPVYVIDAVTNNSGGGGGAVTTWDGRLLGMIGKELRNAQSNTWTNYAIPATQLESITRQIITGQFESAGETTESLDTPPRATPRDFGMVLVPDVVARTPAYIDAVIPGSSAARAGLQPDDLILFVNGELIQSCRAFRKRVGELEPERRLPIVVRRRDQLIEVELSVDTESW